MSVAVDPAVAIRESVALTRLEHVRLVRFRGGEAREAVDALCAGPIRARDGQVQHVLLLDDEGCPFADAYLACDDEEYELIVEGPTSEALQAHLGRHVPDGLDVHVEDRSTSHAVLSLDGPYAWELVSRAVGVEAVGLPYLTFFHADHGLCFRAGKTGEFGYGLIVSRETVEELEARLLELGQTLDVVQGNLDALDQCALENFFFNVRREGRQRVTPIELQLQWRVSYDKHAVGIDAVRRRRLAGVQRRLTCLVAEQPVVAGDEVSLWGEVVGSLVNAGRSIARGDWIALALVDVRWAQPGIRAFEIGHAGGAATARSVSPPVLNNRSLFISPQLHAYATRADVPLPPIARQ